jgi:GT2 family glycosyltransferase
VRGRRRTSGGLRAAARSAGRWAGQLGFPGAVDAVPKIFAIVPVHNRVAQTLRCLESLRRSSVATTAVIVDDGSTDGTPEQVLAEFPRAVVLPGDGDLWWAGATNRGVRYALAHGAEYVLTLNNDGVVAPDAIRCLVDTARAKANSLAGARRNDLADPQTTWSDGWMFDRAGSRLASPVWAAPDTPTRVDATGANLLLIPARCFAEIGLFDADALPQCYCDWDFQLRAAEHGWAVYVEPRAVVFVDRTTSTPGAVEPAGLRHAAFLLTSTRSSYHPVYLARFLRRHIPPARRGPVAGRMYWRLGRMVLRRYRLAPAHLHRMRHGHREGA